MADALASGASELRLMGVQVPPSAPFFKQRPAFTDLIWNRRPESTNQ